MKISIQQIKIQILYESLLCLRHYYMKRYCTEEGNQYQPVENPSENILKEVWHSVESSHLRPSNCPVKRNTDSWPSLDHSPLEGFYNCEHKSKDKIRMCFLKSYSKWINKKCSNKTLNISKYCYTIYLKNKVQE